jgi:hypothetical protein
MEIDNNSVPTIFHWLTERLIAESKLQPSEIWLRAVVVLTMAEIRTSETSVYYETTRRYIP